MCQVLTIPVLQPQRKHHIAKRFKPFLRYWAWPLVCSPSLFTQWHNIQLAEKVIHLYSMLISRLQIMMANFGFWCHIQTSQICTVNCRNEEAGKEHNVLKKR